MTNIKELSPTAKKRIVLTGSLTSPLRLYKQAWIMAHGSAILTPKVTRILEVSDYGVIFEAGSTVYDISCFSPAESGVMCA